MGNEVWTKYRRSAHHIHGQGKLQAAACSSIPNFVLTDRFLNLGSSTVSKLSFSMEKLLKGLYLYLKGL